MDISRRQLAGVILAGTAVAQAPAQTPLAPAAPASDAELEAAQSRQRIAAQIISRVPLPMTVEPAFVFKA